MSPSSASPSLSCPPNRTTSPLVYFYPSYNRNCLLAFIRDSMHTHAQRERETAHRQQADFLLIVTMLPNRTTSLLAYLYPFHNPMTLRNIHSKPIHPVANAKRLILLGVTSFNSSPKCCAQQTGMYMHRLWKQLSFPIVPMDNE